MPELADLQARIALGDQRAARDGLDADIAAHIQWMAPDFSNQKLERLYASITGVGRDWHNMTRAECEEMEQSLNDTAAYIELWTEVDALIQVERAR